MKKVKHRKKEERRREYEEDAKKGENENQVTQMSY